MNDGNNHFRVVRRFTTQLSAPPRLVFPLLCPVREYQWLPHWRCQLIYSASGVAELGCVFATEFPDRYGREVWVVSHYRPDEKIAFVLVGANIATRYEVTLVAIGERTEITWMQELTGLSEAGDELLAREGEARFAERMRFINEQLQYYLEHGAMRPAAW